MVGIHKGWLHPKMMGFNPSALPEGWCSLVNSYFCLPKKIKKSPTHMWKDIYQLSYIYIYIYIKHFHTTNYYTTICSWWPIFFPLSVLWRDIFAVKLWANNFLITKRLTRSTIQMHTCTHTYYIQTTQYLLFNYEPKNFFHKEIYKWGVREPSNRQARKMHSCMHERIITPIHHQRFLNSK